MGDPRERGQERGIIVDHSLVRDSYAPLVNRLGAALKDIADVATISPATHTDRTPKLIIPIESRGGKRTALIPGFVSGKDAQEMLTGLTQVGFTLRFPHPNDPRTPWVDHVHYLLSDFEGRGNKPTVDTNGDYIPGAEIMYANYIANTLRAIGMADSVTILDPHDAESVAALGVLTTVVSALPECAMYMRENDMLPDAEKGKTVIADDGAIGRALYYSEITGIPIGARIIKKRVLGKPTIVDVYGKDNIKGSTAILVDDMIATGGTLFTDSAALRDFGVERTLAVVTHIKGVPEARPALLKKFSNGDGKVLDAIIATNSTPYSAQLGGIDKIKIVDVLDVMVLAARYALQPTANNLAALQPYIFPLGDHRTYIRRLNEKYPEFVTDEEREKYVEAPPTNGAIHEPIEVFATH